MLPRLVGLWVKSKDNRMHVYLNRSYVLGNTRNKNNHQVKKKLPPISVSCNSSENYVFAVFTCHLSHHGEHIKKINLKFNFIFNLLPIGSRQKNCCLKNIVDVT